MAPSIPQEQGSGLCRQHLHCYTRRLTEAVLWRVAGGCDQLGGCSEQKASPAAVQEPLNSRVLRPILEGECETAVREFGSGVRARTAAGSSFRMPSSFVRVI